MAKHFCLNYREKMFTFATLKVTLEYCKLLLNTSNSTENKRKTVVNKKKH